MILLSLAYLDPGGSDPAASSYLLQLAGGLFVILALVVPIWALIDTVSRPDSAFTISGNNKTLWVVLNAVGIAVCGFGQIVGLIYLLQIRSKVRRAQSTAPLSSPPPM